MAERLSMRKVREVLRLKFECRRSRADIAASVGSKPLTEDMNVRGQNPNKFLPHGKDKFESGSFVSSPSVTGGVGTRGEPVARERA
jgi:hypothetical protein